MDITAAEAPVASWIAVGVLLAVAALLLAGVVATLLVRRRAAAPTDSPAAPSGLVDDDLPAFLESPPGSSPTAASGGGFVTLTAPPPPATAPAAPRRPTEPVLAAVAGLAVLLLVVAVVVAVGARDTSAEQWQPAAGAEARMSFAGLVLEQRAVGVTATYPELQLTSDRDGPVARLTLPTWNCLSAEAPDDPTAAGCVPSRTEYAELRPPALEVTESHDGLRLLGSFATSTRPTGGASEPTGRTYRIEVSVSGDGELRPGRVSPATGVLVLEDRETESTEGEIFVGG